MIIKFNQQLDLLEAQTGLYIGECQNFLTLSAGMF